ncbi:MAG TPA: DUF459 domain-containing protein [Allosphingosinicella sp.]|nr:DUF459 domain-containing protein [Allosphingosinicella sp.]
MHPRGRILLLLDRTAVLFIGLGAGLVIAFSFVGGGEGRGGEAQAVSPPPAQAVRAVGPGEIPAPRLARAFAERRRVQIGVFGDSFGDGVWAGLYNKLRSDPRFEVRQYSERSTGFTRYRSLNILSDVRAKLDRQPVDIAVLSFGANDTQGIFEDGHGNAYMSDGWQRIVSGRVGDVVGLLRERGATVYWVGLPRMRDPAFDADIQQMNRFYAERMAALDVPYIDTVPMTVDANGDYAPYLPLEPGRSERQAARTNDGIHMTIPGYIHLVGGLSDRFREAADRAEANAAPANAAAGAAG